jgi:Protein of unknown function (DUF3263)
VNAAEHHAPHAAAVPSSDAGVPSARMDSVTRRESAAYEPRVQELGSRDREILAFERQWWKYAGAKEQAIRELFDMSATRYYQVLNALIDDPAALAVDPMLVKRLRRLRTSRQRARSARRLGIEV